MRTVTPFVLWPMASALLLGCGSGVHVAAAQTAEAQYASDNSRLIGFETKAVPIGEVAAEIEILPAGKNSNVRVTHVTRTSPGLGRQITSYMANMIVTARGPTYVLVKDRFRWTDSPYTGDTELQLRPEYRGERAADVAEVTGYPPVKPDGHYLGLWHVGGKSVVGIFELKNSKAGPVTPLFTSAQKIESVDFWKFIHGPHGAISIMRRDPDGSAQLIDMGIRIKDLAPNY